MMTIKEVQIQLENLKQEATKKSEIKVYTNFLHILSKLENKAFSEEEIQAIQIELSNLNLDSNPKNRKKYFNRALNTFQTYLKDQFALTTPDYYRNLYAGLGASFGVLIGIVIFSSFEQSLGISLGISLGTAFGFLIGESEDAQAKAEGNVLE